MTARDPRYDPRPGDELRKGKRTRRVTGARTSDGIGVSFLTITEGKRNAGSRTTRQWISTWREWSSGAEIVRTAGGEE